MQVMQNIVLNCRVFFWLERIMKVDKTHHERLMVHRRDQFQELTSVYTIQCKRTIQSVERECR